MKTIILLVCSFTLARAALRPQAIAANEELFRHSPTDEYTLPEDLEADKPPVIFHGNVKNARTLALENKQDHRAGKGKFKYSLQTQNGIEIHQVGRLKDENTFVVSGQYSYTGADGKKYRVRYTADEFGYHPITELDVDIPEPESGFQFLKHNINNNANTYGGDANIGDDYNYAPPAPSNDYLPPTYSNLPSQTYLPVA